MCQEKLSLKTKRFRRMASGHCQVQIENVTVYMFRNGTYMKECEVLRKISTNEKKTNKTKWMS